MQRLAHRLYPPAAVPRVLSSTGAIQAATPSPVHLVFTHGLMGCHRNFAAVCTAMSGAQGEASMQSEAAKEAVKAVHAPVDCGEVSGCRPHLATAREPRVYPCVAFDWRNHGDSAHNANMTLDGLAEDVTDFLRDYAVSVGGGTAAATSPLPIILVAHSMGALGVMHWMWTAHLRQWRDNILAHGHGSLKPASAASAAVTAPPTVVDAFSNPAYRVLGAVLIDTAPAERPATFLDTKRLIRALPSIPLGELDSRAAVEGWVLEHGPADLTAPEHLWLLRYQLSNLTFPHGGPPQWKIGLQEIVEGLDRISWRSGGPTCDGIVKEVERLAVLQGLPAPAPPPMQHFHAYYLFGATSPYDTPVTRAAARRLFQAPCVLEMEEAGHFLFMRQKRTFVSTLQNMCYALEEAGGTLCERV